MVSVLMTKRSFYRAKPTGVGLPHRFVNNQVLALIGKFGVVAVKCVGAGIKAGVCNPVKMPKAR